MFHHLKILFRQIRRQKLYSFITISCLAVGLTLVFLTTSYTYYEMSYDQFIQSDDKAIYRMKQTFRNETVVEPLLLIREDLVHKMSNLFPEVEKVTKINQVHPGIRYQGNGFRLEHLITADQNFFDFFPVEIIYGNLENCLIEPKSIVLTESFAKKITGKTDILDEVVTLGKNFDYKVSAIIQDWPNNSHLELEAIIPNSESPFGSSMGYSTKDGERAFIKMYETYVLISKNVDLSELENKFNESLPPSYAKGDISITYNLLPLQDIYLNAESSGVGSRHGNKAKIYLLIAISLVTLFIAGINFVNLTTARASKRAGEIGIKKTVGAGRAPLFRQFMFESTIITFFAAGIAICFAELLLPLMQKLLLVEFSLQPFYSFPGILFVGLGILLISFLAGFYPALYLSRFRPITILRDKTSQNPQGNFVSHGLIILQFSVSIVFIIGAIVISRQLSYVNHIDLGYNQEHLLHLDFDITAKNYDLFKNRLLENEKIKSVTFTRGVPGKKLNTIGRNNFSIKIMSVNYDFTETFQMQIVAGRNLMGGDIKRGCLVNETAFATLGERAKVGARMMGKEIVGVVKDFHITSLHTSIEPIYMPFSNRTFEDVTLRIQSERANETIQYIQTIWNELYPNVLFDFYFYDEKIDSQYRAEQRLGELIYYVTFATILMSCFGLIGLALFAAENKIKEIGIRKVFGASVFSILKLFLKNFVYFVLFANLIAWPIAWYSMDKWLQNFAYRTDLQIWFFFASGLLALFIVVITISITTLKTALANPVDSLRYE
jgi:putative ABC transport system permease protein